MIVCIGLPRTGTTSLCKAYEVLGLKTVHAPLWVEPGEYVRDRSDVYADTPCFWPEFFMRLHSAIPGVRLVWTYRDIDSWMVSMSHHFTGSKGTEGMDPVDKLVYCDMFGPKPHPLTEIAMRRAYHLHHEAAMNVGAVMVDLVSNPHESKLKWQALIEAGGLNLPIPDKRFPRTNKARKT